MASSLDNTGTGDEEAQQILTVKGRPKADVEISDIQSLRALNYNWTKICEILNISRSTLYRRMNEAGFSTDDYMEISSNDLDEIVSDIKAEFPNDGEVLMKSHLLRMGIRVKRKELRDSIHRVDHDNTVARQSTVVKRRIYVAQHPNAMWHMDSHHKLIKWRFVTHAAIDGFSRTIVYVACSDNNRSTTVLQQFLIGTSKFGIPLCVRSDHGGENIKVWEYMLTIHNDASRVITGSSTHNERIERLWRDVHRSVTVSYADTFHALESEKILDSLNEVDIYCLHYIYLPRICKSLNDFQQSWNNHPLSTEGSKTPYQLFYEGLHEHLNTMESLPSSEPSPTQDSEVELNGHDPVIVPANAFKPCSILISNIQIINPLAHSTENGKDLYRSVVNACGSHLQNGCLNCI